MFSQTWREYWGLTEDPFTCEDADKDGVLPELDPSAVHWSFDRLYGSPRVPAPAIIFGEKGSGKSALRLMMGRRLQRHNQEHPDEKMFQVDYIDFNAYLAQYRRAIGARNDDSAAERVMKRWSVADHLDGLLSLGVSKLVDEQLNAASPGEKLSRQQKVYLALLTACYYDSNQRGRVDAVHQTIRRFGLGSLRRYLYWMLMIVGVILGIACGIAPWLPYEIPGPDWLWRILGAGFLMGSGLPFLYYTWAAMNHAARAARAVKILPRNPSGLYELLIRMPFKERFDYQIPRGSDEATRYQLLHRFMEILESYGYKGMYVLLDRIDEPSLLSGDNEAMKKFVESLLDIKLLQFPGLGVKLFLPIELDAIHRNATPEQLKTMRLDKSNLIPELKWSGQELYEIADQRFQRCLGSESKISHLSDLFGEDVDFDYFKETLNSLGTPRYAFGFLSSLFSDHTKSLPNELPADDPHWRVSRTQFDIVKSGWVERAGVQRRVLNA